MKSTCHSEYGAIESIFLKPVEIAWINQEKVNGEWEDLQFLGNPDYKKSVEEYAFFNQTIQSHADKVYYFNDEKGLSLDSLYCRDAAIATDHGMIICNMGKDNRKAEPDSEMRSFIENGIDVLGIIQSPGTIEGGDLAWLDENTLVVGRSYRTNESGIQQLKDLLNPFNIEVIVVDLPHFRGPSDVFHMMSILSPIDKDLAVVYSPFMPIGFRNTLLDRDFRLVEIPDSEFDTQGCNVLALAPSKVLMVAGNPITRHGLLEAGAEVIEYQGDEISSKGGGGPTCLTRPIKRRI